MVAEYDKILSYDRAPNTAGLAIRMDAKEYSIMKDEVFKFLQKNYVSSCKINQF